MLIKLKSPLKINISDVAKFLLNSKLESNAILEEKTSKKILSFHKKESSEDFDEIETDFTEEELGKILGEISSYRTKKIVLALGESGFQLPQLYQVALANNEVNIVESLLQKRADPNEKNEFGTSYLIDAIKEKREKLAVLLVQYGADLTQWSRDYPPDTPLMLAAWKNQINVVDAILEKKVDPHLVGESGQTAIYGAVLGNSLEILKKLLSYEKVDVNQLCQHESLLSRAVKQDNFEIVQMLVEHKANIEVGYEDFTPLILALRGKHFKIAEYLIEAKADCLHPDVLGYAAKLPNLKLIETILDKKVDIESCLDDQITPLMMSVYYGHIENVRKFLSLGADRTRAIKADGRTAIHLAAEEGYKEIVLLLLPDNPTFDAWSEVGNPLTLALKNNHPKVIDILLKHGANVNIKMPTGEDLLAYAAKNNLAECIDILMKYNCPISEIDPYRLIDEAYHEGYQATFAALLRHDKTEMKNYLDVRNNDLLKKVNLSEIKKESSYSNVFAHIYRESQLRIVQRAWRKKHPSEYKVTYLETLTSSLSLRFIQEPIGFKSEEHAKNIKAGKWLNLDFKDIEFERNIYKALRQERITINEMATAYFLYHTKNLMRDPKRLTEIRQHAFDDKGPYSPSTITYAQKYHLDNFKQSLSCLPQHEQCYFSIDFSRKFEMIFLCFGLDATQKASYLKQFQFFLTKFIKKMRILEEEKNTLIEDIERLNKSYDVTIAHRLIDVILSCYPDLKAWFMSTPTFDTEYTSPQLMAATYTVGDQNPYVELSPAYDEKLQESPLLCHIILSISALNKLQLAMHGSDATMPFFTAGQISTRMIRDLDENPKKVGFFRQARPVEFKHPDLTLSLTPHKFNNVHAAIVSRHDCDFHSWRNGALTIKPFIRYLRKLYESVKGYDMSKFIWYLTDMDISAGRSARLYQKSNYIWDRESFFINKILERENGELKDCNNDSLFISLIDMLMNEEQWTQFLGKVPAKYFENEKNVLSFMENIKKIMSEYGANQSILFYIVVYRVQQSLTNKSSTLEEDLEVKEILKELSENPKLLNKLFYWDRNKGIRIKFNFDHITHLKLEGLTASLIIRCCKKFLNSIPVKNKSMNLDFCQSSEMIEFGAKLSSGGISMWSSRKVPLKNIIDSKSCIYRP